MMTAPKYSQIFTDKKGNYWEESGTTSYLDARVAEGVYKEGGAVKLPGPGQDVKVIESQRARAVDKAREFRSPMRKLHR